MASLDLLSSNSRVEVPFIVVTIAGTTFGAFNQKNLSDNTIATDYPNYIQSLNIKKINGQVNTYTLVLNYTVRAGDDPNLIEKVLSNASVDRSIIFTYGDCSIPNFSFKNEKAIITDVKSNFSIASSSIQYTISAVSSAVLLNATSIPWPARYSKPSDVIKEIVWNLDYGLTDVFPGMINRQKVLTDGIIASDDKEVKLQAQSNMTPLAYLSYLVSCMVSNADDESVKKSSKYSLLIIDDMSGEYNGSYFKIVKNINQVSSINSLDTYQIDIGAIGNNSVIAFTIDDNEAYSILYNYSEKTTVSDYIYRLSDSGQMEMSYSPSLLAEKSTLEMSEATRTWWSNVTQFPISGTITIKGLLKPAILMTYVKLNVWFYGRKHISSGYYIVTEQNDSVDTSGFKTTLKLTRIKGDEV